MAAWPVGRPAAPRGGRAGPPGAGRLPARGAGAGDGGQVAGDHAPADPAQEPGLALVAAAAEPAASLADADAALDPPAPALGAPVPALALVRAALGRELARPGQADPDHPGLGRQPLVVGGVGAAV